MYKELLKYESFIDYENSLTFQGLLNYFEKRQKETNLLQNTELLLFNNFNTKNINQEDLRIINNLEQNKNFILHFQDHTFSIIKEDNDILILDSFYCSETSPINSVFLQKFKNLNKNYNIYILYNNIQKDNYNCRIFAIEMLVESINYMKNQNLSLKDFVNENKTKIYKKQINPYDTKIKNIEEQKNKLYEKLNVKEIPIPIPLVPLIQSYSKIRYILNNNMNLLNIIRTDNQTYLKYLKDNSIITTSKYKNYLIKNIEINNIKYINACIKEINNKLLNNKNITKYKK